jgi:electron transport complex protein RnfA
MKYLFLPFIAAFAANSFLSLGFGVRQLVFRSSSSQARVFAPALAFCLAGLAVWPVFAYALATLSLGYLEAVLLAPLSVLLSMAAERLMNLMGGKAAGVDRSSLSAYDGLTYVLSFSILRLCASYTDALLFAFGATVGFLACDVLLQAVLLRSDVEPVPRCLRGMPLMLIAASLIAIIASFLAAAVYASLGGQP